MTTGERARAVSLTTERWAHAYGATITPTYMRPFYAAAYYPGGHQIRNHRAREAGEIFGSIVMRPRIRSHPRRGRATAETLVKLLARIAGCTRFFI